MTVIFSPELAHPQGGLAWLRCKTIWSPKMEGIETPAFAIDVTAARARESMKMSRRSGMTGMGVCVN